MRPSFQVEKRALHSPKLQLIRGLRPELLFERYGMRENPFGVTPDSRYLYPSKTHAEARSSLIVGIECGLGFQALIAPPGLGKTTILFNVLERFNKSARTAFLFQIQGDSRDFLRYLLSELGGEASDSDLVHIQEAINRFLIKERRTGKRTIIVIDEAQSLSASVLETVRLLSNFETPSEKLLQIVLAGQPQLAQQLATPNLTQLHQRISILKTLVPFGLEDTKNYTEHRLRIAGYQGQPLFTPGALRCVWENSHGVPREINTICFNALLLATAVGGKQVDLDILQEVIADLNPVGISGDPGSPSKQKFTYQDTQEATAKNLAASPVRMDEPGRVFSPAFLQFYNLTRNPFEAAPDPCFLCFTSGHSAALAALYSGILRQQGLSLLTGGAGTGKTLITACLMELLKCGHIQAVYVLGRDCSSFDLLKFVGRKLGFSCHQTRDDLRMKLATNFDQEFRDKFTVLLVDEAQDLSIDALQEMQLLTTLQTSQQKILQLVLIGQPEVDEALNLTDFRELKQCIAIHHHIRPLDDTETRKYIACRLRIAQQNSHSGPVFQEDALAAVCSHSWGIPRLINVLCEGALIRGHAQQQMNITSAIIEDVAKQPPSDVALQKGIPPNNGGNANEILKAARVLLDFNVNLQRMRSEIVSATLGPQ